MRKLLSLILILILVLSLAACSSGNNSSGDESSTVVNVDSEPTTSPEPTVTPEPTATPAPTATPIPLPTPEPTPVAVPVEVGGTIDNDKFLMTFDSIELLDEYEYPIAENTTVSLFVEEGYKLLLVKGHFENRATGAITTSSFVNSGLVNGSFELDNSDVKMDFCRFRSYEVDAYTDQDYLLYCNIPNKLAEQFETVELSIGFNDDLSTPTIHRDIDGIESIEADQIYTLSNVPGAQ